MALLCYRVAISGQTNALFVTIHIVCQGRKAKPLSATNPKLQGWIQWVMHDGYGTSPTRESRRVDSRGWNILFVPQSRNGHRVSIQCNHSVAWYTVRRLRYVICICIVASLVNYRMSDWNPYNRDTRFRILDYRLSVWLQDLQEEAEGEYTHQSFKSLGSNPKARLA